jgi:O-antigen ligase
LNSLARRPGTAVRLLLFALAVSGGLALLLLAFPPAAPDRLPVLIVALVLALVSAGRGDRGLAAFCFLFPCTGLMVRSFGGSDAIVWPILLFTGLAAGWTFRFIYDFESPEEPCSAAAPLVALVSVWVLATLLALVRARTLWALWHGLAGRVVNGSGLSEAVAMRESLLALSALGAGAAFFFLLRRSGEAARRRAALWALYGVSVSAAASVVEALGVLPPEQSAYWRMSGRLSGGAADPNSLGLLCSLALVYGVVAFGRERGHRGLLGVLLALFVAGIFLSGSRSAFLLVLFAAGSLLVGRGIPAKLRLAVAAFGAATVLAAALLAARSGPGTLGRRLIQTFDSTQPSQQRISARPLLWTAAWRMFAADPFAGVGVGAFSWRLPDALAEINERLPARDNPGSGYVQALAETGLPGLLLTLWFAWRLGRAALARFSGLSADPAGTAAGVAVLAFLLALALGSHWLAPDVCLLFFAFAALADRPAAVPEPKSRRILRPAIVGVYAAAVVVAALGTRLPAETFRYAPRIGFYEQELGPGGPFRWTRKRFALFLAPGSERRLTLAHFTPDGQAVAIEASTGGDIVFQRSFKPGEGTVLRLSAPAGRPRVVLFRLSRSFSPKRLGLSEDRRELGLVAPE